MTTQNIKLKDIQSAEELRTRIYQDRDGNHSLSSGIYWSKLQKFMTKERVSEEQKKVFVNYCCFNNSIAGTNTLIRYI
jgi:hypothetical protein